MRSLSHWVRLFENAMPIHFKHWMPLIVTGYVMIGGCNQPTPESISSNETGFKVAEAGDKAVSPQAGSATTPGSMESNPTTTSGVRAPIDSETQASAGVPSQFDGAAPSLPSSGVNSSLLSQQELATRSFSRLSAPASTVPDDLLKFFADSDQAIRDLLFAASNQQIDEKQFTEIAKRLCSQKHSAGEELATSAAASPEQKKKGVLAQLEALSHMTGLRDVESAKRLEALATRLSQGTDADLAHQSRLVLLGFRLNALQEGQEKDPNVIVKDLDGLFVRPEDRGYPEFMALQQSTMVLQSMGFAEAAKAVSEKLGKEYRESADPELSMMAWSFDTNGSPMLNKYSDELRKTYQGTSTDPQLLVAAADSLFSAFPSANTLAHIAGHVVNLEYGGQIATSQLLVSFLKSKLEQFSSIPMSKQIGAMIADHDKRIGSIGKPLDLSGLVSFDGQPFDFSKYRGKVVLVDFWATWCMPCLQEIPNIRKAFDELSSQSFDVIGINLDDKDFASVDEFVMKRSFPWRTVRSANPQALGFATPAAARIGISAIPFVVLVDKEGLVASVHVRGDNIIPAVKNLLGGQPTQ